jgi:excisionase family DNA binding protein
MGAHDRRHVERLAEEPRFAMLTPKQAAVKAGVSSSLVYEWCAQGLLPHYRFGRQGRRGSIRIEEAELEAFLVRCRQEAQPKNETPTLKHIRLG